MDLECDMFYVIFWALFFLRVLLYFVKATNNHGIVRIPHLGSDRIFTSFFYGNPSLINLIYFQARSFPKQDLVDFATKRTFKDSWHVLRNSSPTISKFAPDISINWEQHSVCLRHCPPGTRHGVTAIHWPGTHSPSFGVMWIESETK